MLSTESIITQCTFFSRHSFVQTDESSQFATLHSYRVVTGAIEILSVEQKKFQPKNIDGCWGGENIHRIHNPFFSLHVHILYACIQHNTKFIIFIINHKYQSWNQNTAEKIYTLKYLYAKYC